MRRGTAQKVGIGIVGGIAGVVAMRYTMKATRRFVGEGNPLTPRDRPSMSLIGTHHERGEPATEALAREAYSTVTSRELTKPQKAALGQTVHYGFGAAMGAVYAALRGRWLRAPDAVCGAIFGAALWAVADELLVPLLGLADKPTQYPVAGHVQSLAGHMAYGAATGAIVGAFSDQARTTPVRDAEKPAWMPSLRAAS